MMIPLDSGLSWSVALFLIIDLAILLMLIEVNNYGKRLQAAEDLIAQLCGVDDPRRLLEGDLNKEKNIEEVRH